MQLTVYVVRSGEFDGEIEGVFGTLERAKAAYPDINWTLAGPTHHRELWADPSQLRGEGLVITAHLVR